MKVLIVSDDAVSARLVTKKIESWGHRPVVASSGTEAHERISREPFRVVISPHAPVLEQPLSRTYAMVLHPRESDEKG